MPNKAPVMFISHGSPMWAIEPGEAAAQLRALQHQFSDVDALLVISPHWMTRGIWITASQQLETIHDFGGFPDVLYQLQYPAKGEPELATLLRTHLMAAGCKAELDYKRGLDHGAWVPLMHLVPDAEIPVIQLSLDTMLSTWELIELGRVLSELRSQRVAIIATGGITHNLYDLRPDSSAPAAYVERFQSWVRHQVQERALNALCQPDLQTDDYMRAHPSSEHYLPLLLAMGASCWHDSLKVLESPIQYSALSMESYIWSA